jgi:hypothetical protein
VRRAGGSWLVAIVVAALTGAVPMGAKELYRKGDFDVRLDTTLSVGGAVRVQERDSDLVYVGNDDGTGTQGTATNPEYLNRDDGNQNYDQWDVYSANAKALLELDMRWKNYGAFMRANMFYDVVQNCAHCTQRTDLSADARHRPENLEGGVVGTHFLLLDAYLDGQWEVLDRPLELRVGRQVINWGQSLFIQGGVNQTSAIDVAKVRTPGVDFGKEALFPAGFVKVSTEIIRNLGVEAYYQWEWNKTYLDPTGAYFSQSDTTGRGAEGLFAGFIRPELLPPGGLLVGDPGSDPAIPAIAPIPPFFNGFAGCGGVLVPNPTPPPDVLLNDRPCTAQDLFDVGAGFPQRGDDEPDSQGQWGAALRYFIEPIQSEVAAYYMRYHAKTPALGFDVGLPLGGGLIILQPESYFRQYASNVDLVGASFDTEIFDVALGFEFSYRPNDPVVINPGDVLQGIIAQQPGGLPVGALPPFQIDGFSSEKRWQIQGNGIYVIGPGNRFLGRLVEWLHSNTISFIADAAVVIYPELDPTCTADQVSSGQIAGCTAYAGPPDNPTSRDVDATSWGYQFLVQVPYSNPLGVPIDLTPRLIWQHDVMGNTPNQLPFIANRKAISVGVTIDYLQTWTFDVGYTNFFGAGSADAIHDRDWLALNLSFRY